MTHTKTNATRPEIFGPANDQPRDWFFTFGAAHHLFTQNRRLAEAGQPVTGQGIPLDGYYVVIHGDFHSARRRMAELFGTTWSFQYEKLPPLDDLPGNPTWTELIKIPTPGRQPGSDGDRL